MKAVLCKSWGPPDTLVVEEMPSPRPGKGQVAVSVKACGVNFPDVLIIQNKYQLKPELPFTPGSKIAGVVKQPGEGVHGYMPGDPVMALIGLGGFVDDHFPYRPGSISRWRPRSASSTPPLTTRSRTAPRSSGASRCSCSVPRAASGSRRSSSAS